MIKTVNMLSEETFNEASKPEFIKSEGKYTIKSKAGVPYSAGMYTTCCAATDNCDKLLKISIPYEASGERVSPRALVSFVGKEELLIQSDYFTKENGVFTLKKEIPEGTENIKLEMLFYCFGKGEVTFGEPIIEITSKEPHRIVRVASGFIEKKGNFEDNFKSTLKIIEEAALSPEKPDILCFTECVLDVGCKDKLFIHESGEEMQKVCEAVKKAGMYVIFTSHEIDDDGYKYNTSFLTSDKGEVVGKYRKVFLTGMGEIKNSGLTPGSEFPVFDTPLGKIGMIICWDNWFPEATREMAKKGAEMVFWSTRGFHEERPVTRAMDNGVYFIVSHSNPKNCGIIEPAWGKYLARADGTKEQGFVSAVIDLDERLNSQYKSFGKNGSNDREVFITESDLFYKIIKK